MCIRKIFIIKAKKKKQFKISRVFVNRLHFSDIYNSNLKLSDGRTVSTGQLTRVFIRIV